MDNSSGIAVTPASHVVQNQPTTITKDEWQRKYWFNSLQMVTVINPKPNAWPFMVEMRNYNIDGGATERFPGAIANVYLDQMSKILAQDDDRLGFMTDPNLMKIYYDQLIIDVEDLVQQSSSVPAYLRMPQQTVQVPQAERAPWDASVGERASDLAVPVAPPPTFPEPRPKPTAPGEIKPEVREFEQDGAKYKMVLAKTGLKMFYRDGRRTDAAEFNRAASML